LALEFGISIGIRNGFGFGIRNDIRIGSLSYFDIESFSYRADVNGLGKNQLKNGLICQ